MLSIGWFITTWRTGVGYEGLAHIVAVACINATAIGALWWLWSYNYRNGRFCYRIDFTTLVFCWLFWFAFPWFGPLH
jgi:hypothetical protein